eukprot:2517302-Ditylum_brightwellii.AAC.1
MPSWGEITAKQAVKAIIIAEKIWPICGRSPESPKTWESSPILSNYPKNVMHRQRKPDNNITLILIPESWPDINT